MNSFGLVVLRHSDHTTDESLKIRFWWFCTFCCCYNFSQNSWDKEISNQFGNLITNWHRSRLGKTVVHPKNRRIAHHSAQRGAWPEYLQNNTLMDPASNKKSHLEENRVKFNNTCHVVWRSEAGWVAVHPCTDPHCQDPPGRHTGVILESYWRSYWRRKYTSLDPKTFANTNLNNPTSRHPNL